jgi:phosphomannomutase/UTP-glucose-1-phosphate uridylyltransferase
MPYPSCDAERQLRAVILAAGAETRATDTESVMLQTLGEQPVIRYVAEIAEGSVPARRIYVVVGERGDAIRSLLGPDYTYVTQRERLGTGHAVLQLQPLLSEFGGDLLILYGDTPLIRPASIRGLLNRHRLCLAHLTLLTAVVDRQLPYGRIIRDSAGRIIDVIEEADASPEIRAIRELNAGAYVVRAEDMFPVLRDVPPSAHDGRYHLTDSVHQLIRSGLRVESYQIYDQDEVLGINTPNDLETAEFILKKRLYRPRRNEEENLVAFGTGGWRAVIGEGFTLHNVRRLCQALANDIARRGLEKRGVLIGYDRRFLSDRAADAAAEVFAGNNVKTTLLVEDAPTPLITYATTVTDAAYGLAFTASHNPPEWNGLKVFHGDGSLLLDEETSLIEAETNGLSTDEVVKVDLDLALAAGIVERRDFTNQYVDAVEALISLDAIRDAGLRVIVDPMYGTGQLTLGIILTEARCRVSFIHERRNPLFGGRSPAPNLEALGVLISSIEDGDYDLGLATDGDADRIAIVDERGEYITVNDVLLLLYWYLHEVRQERGAVIRNLATTHLLDRLAGHLGEACVEVPVGFKHVAAAMRKHDALLGGESSGGLTIRGHILGKDGIFAAALVVEMLARTGRTISELLNRVYAITGRLFVVEESVPATSDMRVAIPRRLADAPLEHLGTSRVCRVSHLDGTKFFLEADHWALLRFSGTEPVLRLFAESDSLEAASRIIGHLRHHVGLDSAGSSL